MRWFADLHENLDGVRMRGPFFAFSGYFLACAAAGFMCLIFGLFMDKSIARPAFYLVVVLGLGMIVDAVRVTWSERGSR